MICPSETCQETYPTRAAQEKVRKDICRGVGRVTGGSRQRPRGIAATLKGHRPELGQKEQSSLRAMQWRPPPPGKPDRARRAPQRKPWAVLPSFPAISCMPPWPTRRPGKDMQGRVCGPPGQEPSRAGAGGSTGRCPDGDKG